MTCTDCGIPVAPRPQGKGVTPPPAGTRYHQGRGLCSRCYSREQRRNPEPRKRQRACNVELALKGEDNCPACKLARADVDDRPEPVVSKVVIEPCEDCEHLTCALQRRVQECGHPNHGSDDHDCAPFRAALEGDR